MLTYEMLKQLWPRAPDTLVAALAARAGAVLPKYDINTPLRLAHFMAQISHESNGGTITEESLNYTTAARIAAVWPSRFTLETAQSYVRQPRILANKVYNGRMGNRPGTDDGFNFRGRGLLQLTGRESYQRIGNLVGLDLINSPSLVNQPDHALEIAACEFKNLNCLSACDADDIRTVTKRVNGGYIGIDSRRAWLAKWKLALPGLPGKLPDQPEALADLDKPLPREADGDPASTSPMQSKTIWSVMGQIGAAFGAVGSAIAGLDWKVVAVIAGLIILLAVFIGRERIRKLVEDHV
jgi:putative chitinase